MTEREYRFVGAPFELGSRTLGAGGAPEALRAGGLTTLVDSLAKRGISAVDLGDVGAPAECASETNPRHMDELLAYSEKLMPVLDGVYDSGACPVVIGGDHSVSIVSVSAAAAALRSSSDHDAELGLVWVDAHPDLETPDTTPSGDLHGMSVAALLGLGAPELVGLRGFRPKVRFEHVAFIGLRDVMMSERELIESRGMLAYTATDVERLGITAICERVFGHMSEAVSGFVLSFDVDACDPLDAPAVEYPERGGLTFREARLVAEYAAEAPNLLSLEVVEAIPKLDRDARTSGLAVSFIRSTVLGRPVRRPDS